MTNSRYQKPSSSHYQPLIWKNSKLSAHHRLLAKLSEGEVWTRASQVSHAWPQRGRTSLGPPFEASRPIYTLPPLPTFHIHIFQPHPQSKFFINIDARILDLHSKPLFSARNLHQHQAYHRKYHMFPIFSVTLHLICFPAPPLPPLQTVFLIILQLVSHLVSNLKF